MANSKWLNSLVQIALILFASLIVVGATWQVGQSAADDEPRRGEFERHDEGRGERGEHNHEAAWFSVRGIAGFSETLIKFVVVIGAIVYLPRAWRKFQNNMRKACDGHSLTKKG